MRSKIIAALSAVAIALGMVAFTATPASAHTNTIDATVTCSAGEWTVLWSVTNSESDHTEVIKSSTNVDVVPEGTTLTEKQTKTFPQKVESPSTLTLKLGAVWSDNWPADETFHYDSHTVKTSEFVGDCVPAAKVVTANATAVNEVCEDGTLTKGHILVNIAEGVTYKITKADHDTAIDYDAVTGKTGLLDAGMYTVTAKAGKNYILDGGVATKTFDLTIVGIAKCAPKYEVAIYIYPLNDSSMPASWDNSGKQTLIAHRPASSTSDWYTTLPGGLPVDVCGSGWGIQQDIAKISSKFKADDFPTVVWKKESIGVLEWPPIVSAIHQPLSALVGTVPNCTTQVTVTAPTVVSAFDVCDTTAGHTSTTTGTITFASGDWKWYDSHDNEIAAGVHNYAEGTYHFTAVANSGITFDKNRTTTLPFTVEVGVNTLDGPCLTEVIPVTPEVDSHDVCGTANDTLTVSTASEFVTYAVTWNDDHTVATVTASLKDSSKYSFEDGAKTSWTFTFKDEPCVVDVPVAPTAVDQTCTSGQSLNQPGVAALAASYTKTVGGISVGLDTNLEYTITGTGGTTYGPTVVTTAFTPLVPGDYVVTVKTLHGYVFADDALTSWDRTVGAGLCAVTFGDPIAVDQTCSLVDENAVTTGHIWVDLSGNLDNEISYQITGGPSSTDYTATKEINNLEPGKYTVTVSAKSGYKLDSSMQSSWNFTIGAAATCSLVTHPLISTTATMKNLTCSSGGSYTLADTEGVLWYVNGSKTPTAPGTYSVKDATTVNVQAETDGPDFGWEDNAQTSWTFNFTNPVDCLPTLAYTGSDSGMLGLLLAGGFLLFGGTIVAFERRFRANAK